MASLAQIEWLKTAHEAAKKAGHKWPECAACEAAVETGWGQHIPHGSNNVLGIKAYRGWTGKTTRAKGTEQAPTGEWSAPEQDSWCVFPTMEDCFREQMKILAETRYQKALAATTPEAYITEECRVWSTGILKGQAVLQVYHAHKADL